ncbi:MAG: hypothetical protein IMZ64_10325 [Bacteroidetes bacterium]|nr:hypothetical protein [Bacteroidota bacterium]
MNTTTSMEPVQLAGVTYLISCVVSFGVAGIIKLLFGLINLQKNRVSIKVIAAGEVSAKTRSSQL